MVQHQDWALLFEHVVPHVQSDGAYFPGPVWQWSLTSASGELYLNYLTGVEQLAGEGIERTGGRFLSE